MEEMTEKRAWGMLCYAIDHCADGDLATCDECPVRKAGGDEDCAQFIWDAIRRRPKCENAHGGREFECSACGTEWHLLDRADSFDEWAHVRTPRFCPSCGAEVAR